MVAVETDTVSEYRVANSTLRMFDGVAVVPGTAYSVSLRSVNEDGEDTTLPVPFQTQDTGTCTHISPYLCIIIWLYVHSVCNNIDIDYKCLSCVCVCVCVCVCFMER